MIRFRIGSGETFPPRLLAPGSDAVLGLELDGVDVTGGRLEGPLVPVLVELVGGLASLCRGSAAEVDVGFANGAFDLLIAREGDSAALSLVSLKRPAHVVFQDLEVELERLADAAIAISKMVLAASRTLDHAPAERAKATVRRAPSSPAAGIERLRRETDRLVRARWHAGTDEPSRSGQPALIESRPHAGEAPAFGFELRDDEGRLLGHQAGAGLTALLARGHLYAHGPDGEELASVRGPPFLLLRDLSDAALRMLEAARDGRASFSLALGGDGPAIEVDLAGRALTIGGRTLRCRPEALARAIFSAAVDLRGVLLARNPRLSESTHLRALGDDARTRIALCDERTGGLQLPRDGRPLAVPASVSRGARPEPPVAPGSLRRVSLRPIWRLELPRIDRFHPNGSRAWVRHEQGLSLLRLDDGSVEARIPLEPDADVSVAGPRDPLFVLGAGSLACHSPSGRLVWRRSASGIEKLHGVTVPAGSGVAFLHVDGAGLRCVSSVTGEERFRLEPPASHASILAGSGGLLVVAADNGMVYGIDTKGEAIAWRVPLPQPLERLAIAGGFVLGASESHGGVVLEVLRADTGRPERRIELSMARLGSITAVPGGVVVTGEDTAGGELLGVDLAGGIRFRVRPILGPRAPVVVRSGGAIFARGSEGACRVERGRVRWNEPCGPGGPPAIARGVVALPGESLRLLDAATGRSVLAPRATDALPAADHLLTTRAGTIVICDLEGSCAGLRLAGALAVV